MQKALRRVFDNRVEAVDEGRWLVDYFERYRTALFGSDIRHSLIELKRILEKCRAAGKKTIIAGNGGSAAIASHCAVDLTKNAGIRCITFNEADLITCLANDFGYESWLAKALEFYADKDDVVILISSSGESANLIKAAEYAHSRPLVVVTFTGFAPNNRLRKLGDLNVWVDSRAYNVVEMMHQIWLLAVCDLIIGTAEYPAAGPSQE
jgi:D-sedoheptulose 7-phosphate isomerase